MMKGSASNRRFKALAACAAFALALPALAQAGSDVEYVVEIYESPAGAPPPEVAGPQGKQLFSGKLRAPLDAELRQFIPVGERSSDPAKARGISIALTSRLSGLLLETRLTVDTNLPFGQYEQKKDPVWLRSQTTFSTASGTRQFVGEALLAGSITPTVAPPTTSTEPSTASRAAEVAVYTGVGVAASHVPGAGYLPSLGGLFGRGGQPKPRKTVLLFVVTPVLAQPTPDPEPPQSADRPSTPQPPSGRPELEPQGGPAVGAGASPASPSAQAPVATGQTGYPATSLTPAPQIPLVEGLITVSAVSEEQGDYESVRKITAVNPSGVTSVTSAEVNDKPVSVTRTERREDLESAHVVRAYLYPDDPAVFPGTTNGFSTAVLNEIKANGETRIKCYCTLNNPGAALSGLLDGMLGDSAKDLTKDLGLGDGEPLEGTLRRVEPEPVPVAVLVNDVRVMLPTIHMKGKLGDRDAEFNVLDDPTRPMTLRWQVGDARSQTVKIMYPVEAAGTASAPASSSIEKRLNETGRAEVYGIYFDFAKATIKPESELVLKEIAELMTKNPTWTLRVEGHTDNIGGNLYNVDLSGRRSAAVKQALVETYKVAADRLTTSGFGASRPKETNDTIEGRARNRRVELVLD